MSNEESLLSISEASHLLGVSEPALRLWSDEGKINVFVTPGGHRRYLRTELMNFMASNRKSLGIKDLVNSLEDSIPSLREAASSLLQTLPWYSKLDRETQEYFGALGRRLLNLIIKSITEPSKQEETIREVREVGSSFGEKTALLGAPLTDSVHAFVQHRDPITSVITTMLKKREGFNPRIMDTMPVINHAMDEALISLVAAHQKVKNINERPSEVSKHDINITPAL